MCRPGKRGQQGVIGTREGLAGDGNNAFSQRVSLLEYVLHNRDAEVVHKAYFSFGGRNDDKHRRFETTVRSFIRLLKIGLIKGVECRSSGILSFAAEESSTSMQCELSTFT